MANGTQRQIISISLPKLTYQKLNQLSQNAGKTRSQLVKEIIDRFEIESEWEQIRKWGRDTAQKFSIKSEADILRIIND